VRTIIGAEPDPWQDEVMRALVEKRRAAVAGCNGSGKDCMATWLALWMLCTRPFCRGQASGPSRGQVFDTLWPEAKMWIDHSRVLPHLLQWSKTRISWREFPDRWFIAARTAARRYSHAAGDSATEGIQGMHGPHIIIILTEASGVEDPNWDAAESCCTREDNMLLAVGNPLRREGRFYDIFNRPGFSRWYTRHVSYTECSHVDRSLMDGWIEQYGAESAFCQVRCFGQFPAEGAPDSAIPWSVVREAMDREPPEPEGKIRQSMIQVGVDCARFGEDEFVIAIRVGNRILPLKIMKRSSIPEMITAIDQAVREVGGGYSTLIVIDDAGLGGGVSDGLRVIKGDSGYNNVVGIMESSLKPRDAKAYEAWDDEAWMVYTRDWLEAGGVLPEDDILLAQLTTRRYEFTGRNEKQRRLESKSSMRRRGLKSPDRGEAAVFAVTPVRQALGLGAPGDSMVIGESDADADFEGGDFGAGRWRDLTCDDYSY
jgi:hypothetical protein